MIVTGVNEFYEVSNYDEVSNEADDEYKYYYNDENEDEGKNGK